jgi:hypothetical protein
MPDAIDEFLAGYPPAMQAVGQELRAMMRAAMPPQAHEILYAEQNHIGYTVTESMRGGIGYICPMQEYVRLGFYYGGALDDPEHLLEGTGKRMRHVKVRSLAEAQRPAIRHLVTAAWAQASARHQEHA